MEQGSASQKVTKNIKSISYGGLKNNLPFTIILLLPDPPLGQQVPSNCQQYLQYPTLMKGGRYQ